eukprot:758578-Hanusia_phi.AAC.2
MAVGDGIREEEEEEEEEEERRGGAGGGSSQERGREADIKKEGGEVEESRREERRRKEESRENQNDCKHFLPSPHFKSSLLVTSTHPCCTCQLLLRPIFIACLLHVVDRSFQDLDSRLLELVRTTIKCAQVATSKDKMKANASNRLSRKGICKKTIRQDKTKTRPRQHKIRQNVEELCSACMRLTKCKSGGARSSRSPR